MKQLLLSPRIEFIDHAWKYFVNESYIEAFKPYPLTCLCPLSIYDIDALASQCDGLVLCGGYDIASFYFHQPYDSHTKGYTRPVDAYDFALLDAFVKQKKPVLGICRGIQIINVYFHGTLCQHFDPANHETSKNMHTVFPEQGTIFTQLLSHQQMVNSFHHQCIAHLGQDLMVGAYAEDGRIEAIAHTSLPILGVQWHPEKLAEDNILPFFIHLLAGGSDAFPCPSEPAAIRELTMKK